jgi:hypothetical protein
MMPKNHDPNSNLRQRIGGALAAIAMAVLALPSMASALTMIDFDGFTHGEVVTGVDGVTIEADNFNRSFDLAVAFDSQYPGVTADPDLQSNPDPAPGEGYWSGGNLEFEELGPMLILQENDAGCDTGVCSNPDDEGRRPAGTLSFLFDVPILSFGFALIDIDSLTAENGSITFYGAEGGSFGIDFATLLADYEIGNNTANQIKALDLVELQLGAVDRVVFEMGGSGAIDNVNFEVVPEPTTALLMGLGLAGLAYSGRSRRA